MLALLLEEIKKNVLPKLYSVLEMYKVFGFTCSSGKTTGSLVNIITYSTSLEQVMM